MTAIDVSEDKLHREESKVLELLLRDQTTRRNIIWATSSYEYLGKGFAPHQPLGRSKVTGVYKNLIQPRSEKHLTEQKSRTKVRAEVFTPTWIVDKQVMIALDSLKELSFEDYIDSKWLEITCGEAPYIVTPYDTVTGEPLDLADRVGFLDRKLQRISREVSEPETWLHWVMRAYQASYGYEYQGDSLLLARENLYMTFLDYYQEKFSQSPNEETKKKIARIISYNLFQMDGLAYVTPYSEKKKDEVQLSLFEEYQEEEADNQAQETQIKDWKKNRKIGFQRLSSGENEMKFDVVIGNPPYQEELKGTSDKPIYNYFIDESEKIAKKSILITPARFLFDAGKTPKIWNKKMLNAPHLKVAYYEQNSAKVFAGTDIKGGVAITYIDKEEDFGAIGTFTPFSELNSILQKVIHHEGFENIVSVIHLQNRFNLEALYEDYPEYRQIVGSAGKEKRLTTSIFTQLGVFKDEREEGDMAILGLINNKRVYKYINPKYIEDHPNLNKYKVILPSSNGSGAIGEVLSTPLVGFTQTFLSFGAFDTREEAEKYLKYIKTKFARALLGTLKITQHNFKDTWVNVLLPTSAVAEVIDWNQSIVEIDRQFYKLFKFTPEEITFIETKVKEME